jgi:hypothetical protein
VVGVDQGPAAGVSCRKIASPMRPEPDRHRLVGDVSSVMFNGSLPVALLYAQPTAEEPCPDLPRLAQNMREQMEQHRMTGDELPR